MKHGSFYRKTSHSDTEHNVVRSWHDEALAGEQRHLMAVSEHLSEPAAVCTFPGFTSIVTASEANGQPFHATGARK